MAVHQARHTYDPRRPFRAWLFAIVRHKAIDTLRRQRSHGNLVSRKRAMLPLDGGDLESPTMEDSVSQGRLLAALPPHPREAITLTKIDGLSAAEAALRLQISEGTLRVRVHRAIGRLRHLVERDGL